MTEAVRVTLVGKPGCHLCDVARQIVELVCAENDEDFTEVNIYDDPSSADLYAARVPVVLVDGAEVAQFRISAEQLRGALAER